MYVAVPTYLSSGLRRALKRTLESLRATAHQSYGPTYVIVGQQLRAASTCAPTYEFQLCFAAPAAVNLIYIYQSCCLQRGNPCPACNSEIRGSMVCSFCGTENRPENKFCGMCGVRLERRHAERRSAPRAASLQCSACGTVNESGYKFCGNCG